MALNIVGKKTKNEARYNELLYVFQTINSKADRLNLSNDIESFKTYKTIKPIKAVWLYKMGRRWFYSNSELCMKGFININLSSSKEDILNMSDEDFEVLEKLLTKDESIIAYKWKCTEYGL